MNHVRSNVLINPDRFFSELSEREVNLTIPALVVLIWAITDAIYVVIVGALLIRNFPDEAISSGIVIAVLVIQAIVMSVVFGFIWAVLFYTISIHFKGNGSFKRCFEFTGYGFIPVIVAPIIALAVTMVVLHTVELPVESPELMLEALVLQLMQNSLMKTIPVITCLLGLWSVYIWMYGIKHARKISTRNALITVGVPVGIAFVCYVNYIYSIIII
uniref:Yip1 domain-containing protein n=1 Tax=Candidatus Methanogaster sp. ANME-2c ERB4 TaxID=2759911 RepID=A0A7G9YGW3_9EURY|nr:hypothetical protein CAHJBFHG_00004 [Methanosarcinales archaeon ANME-2c ERB4]QNO45780.1 hypothetical protein HJDPDKJO_00004 [Methanosarcinales archaeon ANME-2c ERB4]QNO47206.1 hypothetical protein ADAEDOLL_00012 [Methanosarcinales archaeon ANME-2c ERB4]QNO47247.1 hypothetical protein FPGOGKGP_00006 [Methanosarcinales archaeon ANME-2c ERB4]